MAAYASVLTLLEEDFSGGFPPSGWVVFNGENEPNAAEQYFPGNNDWSVGSLGDNSVAFVFGEDVAVEGGFAQDWLATNLLKPSFENSVLSFDALTFPGNNPSDFSIRISTGDQTDQASYVVAATYTADDFTTSFQTFEVDFKRLH